MVGGRGKASRNRKTRRFTCKARLILDQGSPHSKDMEWMGIKQLGKDKPLFPVPDRSAAIESLPAPPQPKQQDGEAGAEQSEAA
jgi:hypothetical protein